MRTQWPECEETNARHAKWFLSRTLMRLFDRCVLDYFSLSDYPDGQVTQGGYADRIRCDARFAFKIPESISSAEAAPLMCGGVTVFAPLQRYMTKPGMKVGIIGIGGWSHTHTRAERGGGTASPVHCRTQLVDPSTHSLSLSRSLCASFLLLLADVQVSVTWA